VFVADSYNGPQAVVDSLWRSGARSAPHGGCLAHIEGHAPGPSRLFVGFGELIPVLYKNRALPPTYGGFLNPLRRRAAHPGNLRGKLVSSAALLIRLLPLVQLLLMRFLYFVVRPSYCCCLLWSGLVACVARTASLLAVCPCRRGAMCPAVVHKCNLACTCIMHAPWLPCSMPKLTPLLCHNAPQDEGAMVPVFWTGLAIWLLFAIAPLRALLGLVSRRRR